MSARVRGEIHAGELIVSLEAEKGSPEEARALDAMEYLVSRLVETKLSHKTFERQTSKGDRIDQVRIRL